jgi:YHS domain-containing protein
VLSFFFSIFGERVIALNHRFITTPASKKSREISSSRQDEVGFSTKAKSHRGKANRRSTGIARKKFEGFAPVWCIIVVKEMPFMKKLKTITAITLAGAYLAAPLAGFAAEKKNEKAKPYPLDTCIVSGEKLGEMGKAYVFAQAGQEVRLCCKDCQKKFDADPAKYMKTIAEAKVYPLDTCVVSGEKLGEMGKAYVFAHDGHVVKLCCQSCQKDFKKDPAKYLKKIKVAEAEKAKAKK